MKDFINKILEFLKPIWDLLTYPIFDFNDKKIDFILIVTLLLSIIFVIAVSNAFRNTLVNRILKRTKIDTSLAASIGTISKYIILVIGFLIIVETAGIDLSSLGLIAGALGVGIGFGLQNITNNFISGLIILFERPIKIGDRIQIGDLDGDVTEIAARATTILTNDNISVIVPNSSFIDSQVINWSHNDRKVRFKYPVSVSYREDPKRIRRILLEVAAENNGVLTKPSPDVLFDSFGDSGLVFHLVVWTTAYTERPRILKSQLYYAIFKKFRDNGIEIPFPQRDLHFKSGFEWIRPEIPEEFTDEATSKENEDTVSN